MSANRDNPYFGAKMAELMEGIHAEHDAAARIPDSIIKGPRIQPSSVEPTIEPRDAFMALIDNFHALQGDPSART